MQVLSQVFETRHYRYTQVERQGTVALYRSVPKASGKAGHEVVVITIKPAHTTPDGWDIDDQEVYPADEALGRTLWRYDSRRDAEQQFRRLVMRAAHAADEQPAPEEPSAAATGHADLQPAAGERGSS